MTSGIFKEVNRKVPESCIRLLKPRDWKGKRVVDIDIDMICEQISPDELISFGKFLQKTGEQFKKDINSKSYKEF